MAETVEFKSNGAVGGMLAFIIAANRPDTVKAVVPFSGFPKGATEPDWSKMTATIRRRTITSLPPRHVRSKSSCGAWGRT
jgi:homoserine acetyltransferase